MVPSSMFDLCIAPNCSWPAHVIHRALDSGLTSDPQLTGVGRENSASGSCKNYLQQRMLKVTRKNNMDCYRYMQAFHWLIYICNHALDIGWKRCDKRIKNKRDIIFWWQLPECPFGFGLRARLGLDSGLSIQGRECCHPIWWWAINHGVKISLDNWTNNGQTKTQSPGELWDLFSLLYKRSSRMQKCRNIEKGFKSE